MFSDQMCDHFGGSRRHIRRFDQHVIARRQCPGHRRKTQECRVVPGPHDADHTLRLKVDSSPCRQGFQGSRNTAGLHPGLDLRSGVANFTQRTHDLTQQRFVHRPVTEVRHHSFDNFVTVPANGARQGVQPINALLGIGRASPHKCRTLLVQQPPPKLSGVSLVRFKGLRVRLHQNLHGFWIGSRHLGDHIGWLRASRDRGRCNSKSKEWTSKRSNRTQSPPRLLGMPGTRSSQANAWSSVSNRVTLYPSFRHTSS